ncbi:MAG: hypothetical protein WCQ86_07250 [Bacteroidaceae bacterium]
MDIVNDDFGFEDLTIEQKNACNIIKKKADELADLIQQVSIGTREGIKQL